MGAVGFSYREVFSACAEVVPLLGRPEDLQDGILRVRGGSSTLPEP